MKSSTANTTVDHLLHGCPSLTAALPRRHLPPLRLPELSKLPQALEPATKIHRPFFSLAYYSVAASPLPLCSTKSSHLAGQRNPKTFTIDRSSPCASSSPPPHIASPPSGGSAHPSHGLPLSSSSSPPTVNPNATEEAMPSPGPKLCHRSSPPSHHLHQHPSSPPPSSSPLSPSPSHRNTSSSSSHGYHSATASLSLTPSSMGATSKPPPSLFHHPPPIAGHHDLQPPPAMPHTATFTRLRHHQPPPCSTQFSMRCLIACRRMVKNKP